MGVFDGAQLGGAALGGAFGGLQGMSGVGAAQGGFGGGERQLHQQPSFVIQTPKEKTLREELQDETNEWLDDWSE